MTRVSFRARLSSCSVISSSISFVARLFDPVAADDLSTEDTEHRKCLVLWNNAALCCVTSLMRVPPSLRQVLVCCFFLPWVRMGQAQQSQPAIEQVLSQLETNTEKYTASVPSFTCDEHITSQEIHAGKLKHETVVESTFRVSRSVREAGVLEESREVRDVNRKPSAGKKLNLPLAFSGGFSGALTKFLSDSHRQCFSYRQESSSAENLSFSFVANEGSLEKPACRSIQRGTTGKVIVNAAAMQVTHIERTVPFPVGKDPSVLSTAAVDFAPVKLNETIYWLPVTVTAFTAETAMTDGLRFKAAYSSYHQFAATSTIVPVAP